MGGNIAEVGSPECGEVDILENFGPLGYVSTFVHTPNDSDNGTLGRSAKNIAASQWHTWRMEWEAGEAGFTFFLDGRRYLNVRPGDIPNWCFGSGVPLFMILNLAIGGAAGPPGGSTKFPVDMLVDYVRVW